PVSIPVSTTSSPDEKSALVIHHDSVEQVVARRAINKIVSDDPIRAAVCAIAHDAVAIGCSNHINAAGGIRGDAVSCGTSATEGEIIHGLPILGVEHHFPRQRERQSQKYRRNSVWMSHLCRLS